jgi:hypothetical protein
MTTLHLRKSIDRSPLQSRFLLIPLLLACFAAVFISIPTPAAARDLVPFKATFTGSSTSAPGFPCAALRSDIAGGGHATHLGNFTTVQHHCFDPADPTLAFTDGFYTFTGANGDTIFGTYHGHLVLIDGPVFAIVGEFTIEGGTGRFVGATGGGTASGTLNVATGVTTVMLDGAISSPGSLH